jgi:hypothetical protein
VPAGRWYTLIRMRGGAQQLTVVAQVRDARAALDLLESWVTQFPDESGVVFDPDDARGERLVLEWRASVAADRGRRGMAGSPCCEPAESLCGRRSAS